MVIYFPGKIEDALCLLITTYLYAITTIMSRSRVRHLRTPLGGRLNDSFESPVIARRRNNLSRRRTARGAHSRASGAYRAIGTPWLSTVGLQRSYPDRRQ